MKIAINGDIIYTDNIYKISEIESDRGDHISHKFTIVSYNQKYIEINYSTNCYLARNYVIINDIVVVNPEEMNLNHIINSLPYQETLSKITKFRQSIIDVWSNNQSIIPEFNLS